MNIKEAHKIEVLAFNLFASDKESEMDSSIDVYSDCMALWRHPESINARQAWRLEANKLATRLTQAGVEFRVCKPADLNRYIDTIATQPATVMYSIETEIPVYKKDDT